jgi:hypothetical protein
MELQFRSPRNPLEWIVTVLAVGVIVALGFVLASIVIVAVGVAILIAPVVAWWRRRKGGPPPGGIARDESAGRVVDVEFEVEKKSDDGSSDRA